MNKQEEANKRFTAHTIISLIYGWPIYAWYISFSETASSREGKFKFISLLPLEVIELLTGSNIPLGIMVAIFSLALMVLGVMSMEFPGIKRWVVTFPLLLVNLACFGFYTYMVM